ncbi:MAG: hypothetical protein SFV54_28565 [Bryobacteraceae bacterium]|nr:hypothetical protein [Bryobacteraceae bacterium]
MTAAILGGIVALLVLAAILRRARRMKRLEAGRVEGARRLGWKYDGRGVDYRIAGGGLGPRWKLDCAVETVDGRSVRRVRWTCDHPRASDLELMILGSRAEAFLNNPLLRAAAEEARKRGTRMPAGLLIGEELEFLGQAERMRLAEGWSLRVRYRLVGEVVASSRLADLLRAWPATEDKRFRPEGLLRMSWRREGVWVECPGALYDIRTLEQIVKVGLELVKALGRRGDDVYRSNAPASA